MVYVFLKDYKIPFCSQEGMDGSISKRLKRSPFQVVPWHQDNGYLNDSALQTMTPTAWIPLLDTNEHNGGMQVLTLSVREKENVKHVAVQK